MRLSVLFLTLALLFLGCKYLKEGYVPRTTSGNEHFSCELTPKSKTLGLRSGSQVGFSMNCQAKKGRVSFHNLRVYIISRAYENGRNKIKNLGETKLSAESVHLEEGDSFKKNGKIKVSALSGFSGQYKMHMTASISYPDEGYKDEALYPGKYDLLVAKPL